MSEPVTALKNASYTAGIAEISEIGPQGMITLRGDLTANPLRKAARDAAQVAYPETRMCHTDGARGLAWMSPDELLILCPYDAVAETLGKLQKPLSKHHALAVNVSDARALFRVGGPHAREVLAKLAPVDLAPDAFTPGMFRRTRLAQVPAAFWLEEDGSFRVICFRSVAQYVYDLLKTAAQPGSEVGYF
jgi:sarcosine oxidase, subunit gamma